MWQIFGRSMLGNKIPDITHKVAECRKGFELAGIKKLMPMRNPVSSTTDEIGCFGIHFLVRDPARRKVIGINAQRRGQVYTFTASSFGYNCHELRLILFGTEF